MNLREIFPDREILKLRNDCLNTKLVISESQKVIHIIQGDNIVILNNQDVNMIKKYLKRY